MEVTCCQKAELFIEEDKDDDGTLGWYLITPDGFSIGPIVCCPFCGIRLPEMQK